MQRRIYVDGAPCSNGCGRTFLRRNHTALGLCKTCDKQRIRATPFRRKRRRCACGWKARFRAVRESHIYATPKCKWRLTSKRQWDARRLTKVSRHPNTVLIWELRREMDAQGKRGYCIYCEEGLAPKQVLICSDPDCATLYNDDWRRGKRMLERQAEEARQAA